MTVPRLPTFSISANLPEVLGRPTRSRAETKAAFTASYVMQVFSLYGCWNPGPPNTLDAWSKADDLGGPGIMRAQPEFGAGG